jgi:hypothetical protein
MLAESGRSKFQLNWLENKKKCGAVNMIGLTYFVCTGKILVKYIQMKSSRWKIDIISCKAHPLSITEVVVNQNRPVY